VEARDVDGRELALAEQLGRALHHRAGVAAALLGPLDVVGFGLLPHEIAQSEDERVIGPTLIVLT
jgi:hypothetical protein